MNSSAKGFNTPEDETAAIKAGIKKVWPELTLSRQKELGLNFAADSFFMGEDFAYNITPDWKLTIIERKSFKRKIVTQMDEISPEQFTQMFNQFLELLIWINEDITLWLWENDSQAAMMMPEELLDEEEWIPYSAFHDKYISLMLWSLFIFVSWWEIKIFDEILWNLITLEQLSLRLSPSLISTN